MTQNSKQSQNKIIKNKKSVTFTIAVMQKRGKELEKHNVIWKTMRTSVLEFL